MGGKKIIRVYIMLCLSLESTDPYFNLAVDEYLLKNSSQDFLILGINDKSVIIGKHQVCPQGNRYKIYYRT